LEKALNDYLPVLLGLVTRGNASSASSTVYLVVKFSLVSSLTQYISFFYSRDTNLWFVEKLT
jgi:hypothetical protein